MMKKKTGILLVNLGTPDSPKPADVYRYLIEFLTDARVIDTSWIARQCLVRGLIVPTRYRQSAKLYQEIWTAEGSPLKVYGFRIQKAIQELLGEDYQVELAMRYQNPSLPSVLEKFKHPSLGHLIVLPLFPQYASATTGSVHQKIMEELSQWNIIPEVTFINNFATYPGFINSFKAVAAPYDTQKYDHILFSFHGLPQRQLIKADRCHHCLKTADCCQKLDLINQNCYSAQCYATAKLIAGALNLSLDKFSVSFQSRLGKEPWLTPSTSEVIEKLAKDNKKKVLVFCPSFICDCLETTSEIGIEYKEEFIHAGGEELDLVPGLNDHPEWIKALVTLLKTYEKS